MRFFIDIALMCAFEYIIKKVQENLEGFKLNGTHKLMACADDINLVSENMCTKKKFISCQ
jgi:hypothetical protein